jgi:radical SAM protein with 4Fe4S-binding SPASM domain
MTLFCSAPYIYTFEITSACNADCVGCGNVFPHDGAYITAQECQTILKHVKHPEMFRVTGGEPTISPEFPEIMRLLDRQEKPIVVFTNGAWEEPDSVLKTLQACKNLDGILVSLHGHSQSSYQAFTRTDHFSRVLANIRRANEAGIDVNTNTILTHRNIGHMADVVEIATQAGAKVVAFSRYYGVPIPGLTDLSPEQYKYAVDQVSRLRAGGKLVKFNNNIPFCLGGQLTQACPAGDTHCTVSPTGEVRLCNHSPYSVGNILQTPVEQMWHSDAIEWWRKQIPPMCQQCAAFDLCRGGCRANAMTNGLAADPLARGPCRTTPKLPKPLKHLLYDEAVPKADFSLHKESFGYVLANRSRIFKVADEAKPILDALQQRSKTLAEIRALFGPAALNFIGVLYDNRMVELMETSKIIETPRVSLELDPGFK